MPLNVQDLVDQSSDKLLGNKSILSSSIYTAFIITLILLILTWLTLKGEIEVVYDDTSLLVLLFKSSVWGFLISIITLFLHDRAINKLYKEKYENMNAQQIVNTATLGPMTNAGTITPVLNTQPTIQIPNITSVQT